ncbi:hypothetical protein F4679DRAFT_564701 [Xylaria curta]|nr:hypothetical protein F4679DRAFT_564701 [Xylaria curta]
MLSPSNNVEPVPITNPKEPLNTPISTNNVVLTKLSPILPRVPRSTNNVYQSAYMPSFSCHFNLSSSKPCGKHFADESTLRQHVEKAHHFLCERGCIDVGFVSSRDLERHYNTAMHRQDDHNGLFVCGGCSRAQDRHDNHFRHVRTCGKNKSMLYKCGRCGNQSNSKTEHLDHWETKCKKK